MKKVFIFLLTTILTVSSLTGCSGGISTGTEKIDKSMTGYEDFYTKLNKGDEVVVVYGTIGSKKDTALLYDYARLCKLGMFLKYKDQFILKSDVEVNSDDIKNRHIILLGNPKTNQFFAKVNEQLPIKVTNKSVVAGKKILKDESIVFRYLIPNPLNKKKYMFVNGALNNEYLYYIRYVSMHTRREEYVIKANKNDRYSGKFDKTDTQWVINKLGQTTTEDNFLAKESEHFIFHYSDIDDKVKQNIDKIIEKREKIYEEISNKLKIDNNGKIDYYLFMSDKVKEGYKRWDNDFWLGNIYEVYKEENKDIVYYNYIYNVLINEIGMPLSSFSYIGLFGALFRDDNYGDMKIEDIVNSDDYIPLQYLTSYIINPELERDIYIAEMFSFAKYLIDKYGLDKYLEYYRANLNEEMDKALCSVYNKDLLELEGEWLDYLDSIEGDDDEE